ncbi:MAG: DNA helicase UvrD, partial [Gammaproteobacteria bacterium]|nr:DNA helicase UvrD [Gammaproteobacteria bacterium]
MSDLDLSPLAEESLRTFDEIVQTANTKLNTEVSNVGDVLATTNTLTGGQAVTNLNNIWSSEHESLQQLCEEPAILRLVLKPEEGQEKIIYISRNGNVPLPSKTALASYRSPLGRAAEIPPGEEVSIVIQDNEQLFCVLEKISYNPKNSPVGWDSLDSQYRHYDKGTFSIQSLRALLKGPVPDGTHELDRLLEQAEAEGGMVAGIRYQVRTAMGLRDQPILDQFQGEIFRLPLDSHLIIMGPPGTGKTTTLIKRLGQKLDLESLEAGERRIAESTNEHRPHKTSWLMFSPSDLLKHYLKEAFSREQIPASDSQIRTWESFRNDIARNKLDLLRTANAGRFTLKADIEPLSPTVITNAGEWFKALLDFHEARLRQQLLNGIKIIEAAISGSEQSPLSQLNDLKDRISGGALIEVYRALV